MNYRTGSTFLPLLLVLALARKVFSLQCYKCDNMRSAACGPVFRAYQFDAEPCDVKHGIKPICGKQVQPPVQGGWVGVIRSCYYSGDLPGLNASTGCQYHYLESGNFTALFCFCGTDNCNGSSALDKNTTAMAVISLFMTFTFISHWL